jgi:hypothetical protein
MGKRWTYYIDDGHKAHVLPVNDAFSERQAMVNGSWATRLEVLEAAESSRRLTKRRAAEDVQRLKAMIWREKAKVERLATLQDKEA